MDASGSVLYSGDNLAAYTTYTDTFDLQTGCYELVIHDRSKNGLNFWANNDGAGRVRLRDGGSFFQNMNTDFGTELRIPFTVGFGIGLSENEKAPRPEIFPNPANDQVTVDLFIPRKGAVLSLIDATGRKILEQSLQENELQVTLNVDDLPAGLYILEVSTKESVWRDRLVIE